MNAHVLKRLLRPQSPLLFANQEERDQWCEGARANPGLQSLLEEIRQEGKRLLNEQEQELTFSLFKLFALNGSRIEYEKVYFAKRRRLNTFAILAFLWPDEDVYLEALQNTIWSVCNEYTWCLPAHLLDCPETEVTADRSYTLDKPIQMACTIDLFAAETAFTFSEILSLLGDALDPLLCKRMRDELYTRIFHPFHRTRYRWETHTHNWAAVCAGSVGSAALHVMTDTEDLAMVLERVLSAMDHYLQGFQDDGFCLEGYGYWQYGFGFYVYFADLLKKRTAGQLDLFAVEKVHQIALFQQRCFLHGNKVVNFSDALSDASIFLGLSHYLHKVYADFASPERMLRAAYTDDHCSRWAPAIRNLLWFDDTAPEHAWQKGTLYAKQAQWFISRHQTEAGSFSFAAKGGHNDEPHNHNDIGHFILQGNGEWLCKDLGSGLYTRDYFQEKRYTFVCNGSQGHSVPIINHQHQVAGLDRRAVIQHVSTGGFAESFSLDLARAYSDQTLLQLKRTFTWEKVERPILVMEDTYMFTERPGSIVERLITPDLDIMEEEEGVLLQGMKTAMLIRYDRCQLQLGINRFHFLNHFGDTEANLALDFTMLNLEKECSAKLVFQFV
ncbi:MAG TPA: heparinase II/III family protein [Candidatus Bathyarchaeia archaeon]|nr:heparinase II/III family protein [Candidatus Bathyarchaeia archaeon]